MSKEDYKTNQTLLNPYIEIGKGCESSPNSYIHLNVSTFKNCLAHLIPSFTDNGQRIFDEATEEKKLYSVYGVVGKTVTNPNGASAYLNITEPPISRTLMGFLLEDILIQNLPEVHRALNS